MSNMDKIRKYHNGMSKGEKQYMANKLWSADKVVAQKLQQYIPDDVLRPVRSPLSGDIFETGDGGHRYMLATVGSNLVALVSLEDGNRWKDAVYVLDNLNITPREWYKVVGTDEKFQLIPKGAL
jgi:hypothetical protein